MSSGADLSLLTKSDLSPAVGSTEIKCYASCKSVHSPLEAAQAIYQNRSDPAQIPIAIKVLINASAMHMAGRMYDKDSIISAQLSIPYGVALALSGRDGSAADYTLDRIGEEDLFQLASIVEMEVSPEMDALRENERTSSAIVQAAWSDGSVSREFVKCAKGTIEKPLTGDERIKKFLSLAEGTVGSTEARRLAEQVLHGDRSVPVRSLFHQAHDG
ncbi:MAG: MmgE/PrpD family protein [Clostridiales bacterium]|nr:MmgE/PrpD family protein [Clostridiales bacterium]